MVEVSIIIVSFNTKLLIEKCIKSIITHSRDSNIEIIVVDNNSTDGSIEYLTKASKKDKRIHVILNSKNLGFGAANNVGLKRAIGDYILLLNSDTCFIEDVLSRMIVLLERGKDIGIASCALVNSDGSLQGSGGYFPTLARVFAWMFFIDDLPIIGPLSKPFHPMRSKSKSRSAYYQKQRALDWVTGAFLFMRRRVYEQTGGFDEDYFMYTEEVDLCYRAKMYNWEVFYDPSVSIIHYGGASSTSEFSILSEYKGIKLFYQKHYSLYAQTALAFFLKAGALLRMVLFGILEGKASAKIYGKAFKMA